MFEGEYWRKILKCFSTSSRNKLAVYLCCKKGQSSVLLRDMNGYFYIYWWDECKCCKYGVCLTFTLFYLHIGEEKKNWNMESAWCLVLWKTSKRESQSWLVEDIFGLNHGLFSVLLGFPGSGRKTTWEWYFSSRARDTMDMIRGMFYSWIWFVEVNRAYGSYQNGDWFVGLNYFGELWFWYNFLRGFYVRIVCFCTDRGFFDVGIIFQRFYCQKWVNFRNFWYWFYRWRIIVRPGLGWLIVDLR
jgi:hypothetical protein